MDRTLGQKGVGPFSVGKHSPRAAAFFAVLYSFREEHFIQEMLSSWIQAQQPDSRDIQLAHELAKGTCQQRLLLDYYLKFLAKKQRLKLNNKERAIAYLALYQRFFLSKIPLYAITNEMVALAKRHTSKFFARFIEAVLRNKAEPPPPSDLHIQYSYPAYYVEQLLKHYETKTAESILQQGNTPATTYALNRSPSSPLPSHCSTVTEPDLTPLTAVRLEKGASIPSLVKTAQFYVQGLAPIKLMSYLSTGLSSPKAALDLCASPGGKTILLHTLYPDAALDANDLTPAKTEKMKENFSHYSIPANVHTSAGENFSFSQLYDLIVIDAPCSNTGVLNKRPEARWRLSPETMTAQVQQQKALLEHALSGLAPGGQIWYLTCSILPEENELLIRKFCADSGLTIVKEQTILPTIPFEEGAYGVALQK